MNIIMVRYLGQYFPKGSSFQNITAKKIPEIEDKLNHRPRKTLRGKTPYEVFYGIENVAYEKLGYHLELRGCKREKREDSNPL